MSEKAIAVDVGGTHISCAIVVDDSIQAVERLAIQDASLLEPQLGRVSVAVRSLLDRCRISTSQCAGMALAFPGIIDSHACRVLSTPSGKYSDACSLDLARWCREELGVCLGIENDARMALLGERRAGAAQGFDDIVMVTLGTGVGAAAMMEGRLLRGKHFQGGCLGGHIPAVWDGRRCICGNIGCVEAEASTWALPGICASWPGYSGSMLAREPQIHFQSLFRCSEAGDAVASAVRKRCIHIWAAGIVGLIHVYDPEIVVLGGAVMSNACDLLPAIAELIHARAWTPWGKVQVCPSSLGSEAALLGAMPLLRELC